MISDMFEEDDDEDLFPGYFEHVTSVRNRESILRYGLDWQRMGAASGIAGSRGPEKSGCFLTRDDFETEFFIDLNNTGGPVDIWRVAAVDDHELLESDGFLYVARTIPAKDVTLVKSDIAARELKR